MAAVIVLNMGMKSIRSILFDEEGNKLASSSRLIATSLAGETVTQDPTEWWETACQVIRETVADAGNLPVDYLTVTTSSSCLVCVDSNVEPLLPSMMVSDKRAQEESAWIAGTAAFPAVQAKTGLGMDSSFLLPKALWVKRHREDLYARIDKLLSPNDYFLARFTGKFVSDYMNATKWHYDTETKRYPSELLEEIGISEDLLPAVQAPGSYVGNLLPAAAERTGLTTETKVIMTTYDAICSLIGSGVLEEGEASDVSGTVTVFRAAAARKPEGLTSKIQHIPYYEGNIHIVGGSNNLGGGLIEWVKQCYYQNEPLPYEIMEKDAGEAPIGAGGLIFLPYLLGERAPVWDSCARGVFFGLERAHTRKEMTRAVFESAGFIDLDMIAAVEETGINVTSVRLSGGLARLHLVSQIKADVMGREVQVLSEFETTATGAAMIALYGQGVYGSLREAADRFVQVRMVIRPDMKNHKKYLELYKLYKDAYRTLKPLFPQRMALTEKLYGRKQVKIENL